MQVGFGLAVRVALGHFQKICIMKSLELKWGVIIGLAGMLWLYVSYYIGMHESLAAIQGVCLVSFLVSTAGFIFALRAIRKNEPEIEYLEGLKSGTIIAGITAVVAAISQVGYFKLINPGWTKFMVAETRSHFEKEGASKEAVELAVTGAWKTFALKSYLIQSMLCAVVIGIILSAIIMLFLRKRRY